MLPNIFSFTSKPVRITLHYRVIQIDSDSFIIFHVYVCLCVCVCAEAGLNIRTPLGDGGVGMKKRLCHHPHHRFVSFQGQCCD